MSCVKYVLFPVFTEGYVLIFKLSQMSAAFAHDDLAGSALGPAGAEPLHVYPLRSNGSKRCPPGLGWPELPVLSAHVAKMGQIRC